MFEANFDPIRRRLELGYVGFWSPSDAVRVHLLYKSALDEAGADGRPFTLLNDLRELKVQTGEVVALNSQFAELSRGAPILRYAMVVPSALMRRQVMRTVDGLVDYQVFEEYVDADAWLARIEPQ